jgi:glycosyltransferase involved in cell wall biosynthesis
MNLPMNTNPGNAKIKLLLFTGSLESGGAERFTVFLCNHLPRESFELVLVVFSLKGSIYQVKDDVTVINLNRGYKTSLFDILKVIRQQKPHLIFSTLTVVNIMMAISRIFIPRSIPIIARESSIMSHVVHHFPMPRLISLLVTLTYPRFTCMVAQSKAMKEDLVQQFGIPAEKIMQIYNPVDAHPLKPARQDAGILQLVTVGNIRKEKGHDRLIHALQHVRQPFHYTIVGGGVPEEIEKVKALINQLGLQDKVTLTGAQQNPFQYLEKADLFLQGSYFEGFPNGLLEANAVGLPIVAYACPGGTAEIIVDGQNGFLVTTEDDVHFASIIEKAANYAFDAKAIRNQILTRFDKGAILQAYTTLLLRIAEDHN